ncbi:MAG: hypothetical protein AAFR47_01095, partial [Pseudomonadota bacterium]
MDLAIRSLNRGIGLALILVLSPIWPDPLSAQTAEPLPAYVVDQFGEPPAWPDGPLSPDLEAAVQAAIVASVIRSTWGQEQSDALEKIAASEDPRLVWLISDLMRFVSGRQLSSRLNDAASTLLKKDLPDHNHWGNVTDHLIAWDIPAPPNYLPVKRAIFTSVVPGWDKIFVEGDIDWRHVSWGGVLIDDRAYDTTDERCNCIPAA